MTRRLITRSAAVGLIALWGACSDDTTPNTTVDARRDVAVDMGQTEGGSDVGGKKEASVDASSAYFMSTLLLSQLVGPPMSAGSTSTTLGLAKVYFEDIAKSQPDYIDTAASTGMPPFCMAYKWSKGGQPAHTDGDAGKVTIKGLEAVQYVDGNNPGAPQNVPSPIECTRKEIATGIFAYSCGLPETTILTGDWLKDSSAIDFEAAGGKDVAAFTEKGVAPTPAVEAKTDLNALDPASIKIEWKPVSAMTVVFVLSAALSDGSEFAEVQCVAMASAGSHTVPAGALAVLPKPTATAQLNLFTALFSMTPKGKKTTWGDYSAAVTRGVWGMTCRTPTGLCPQN